MSHCRDAHHYLQSDSVERVCPGSDGVSWPRRTPDAGPTSPAVLPVKNSIGATHCFRSGMLIEAATIQVPDIKDKGQSKQWEKSVKQFAEMGARGREPEASPSYDAKLVDRPD